MFGLGFGEMVMLAIVLLVVVGPRDLPRLLRTVGQGLNKLRQMTADLRAESGIDEIIEDEGLREDLASLREISRGGVVESLVRDSGRSTHASRRAASLVATAALAVPEGSAPEREREYPEVGCDAYGALSDEELPYLVEAATGTPGDGAGGVAAGHDGSEADGARPSEAGAAPQADGMPATASAAELGSPPTVEEST